MPIPSSVSSVNPLSVSAPQPPWTLRQWAGWLFLPFFAIALGGIYIFSGTESFQKADYWQVQQSLFLLLNHEFQLLPAALWSNLTLLGDAAISVLILSLLVLYRPQAWAALFCTVPAAGIFANVGKSLASMPRPGAVLNPADFNVIGPFLQAHNSFPSGHSISSFAVAIAVAATLLSAPKSLRDKLILAVIVLVAVLMCLSRVAVGAHWPVDTLIGGALGWLAGLSGALWARKQTGWWQKGVSLRAPRFVLAVILLIWSGMMINRGLDHPPEDIVIWIAACCGLVTAGGLLRPIWNKTL